MAVWWLATGDTKPSDMRRWLRVLDSDERERAARFRIEADRREFVAAHALLRTMLTYHLGVPPTAWRFLVDANGKPSIDPNVGPHQLQFNLSHTRGLVAVALASRGAVGVDVEEIDEAKADLAIAEAYFARSEVEMLQKAPPLRKSALLFSSVDPQGGLYQSDRRGAQRAVELICLYFGADPHRLLVRAGKRRLELAIFNLTSLRPSRSFDRSASAGLRGAGPDDPGAVAARSLIAHRKSNALLAQW